MTAKKRTANVYPFEGLSLIIDHKPRHCNSCVFTNDCLEETGRADRFEKMHMLKPCYEMPECHYTEQPVSNT